MSFDASYFLFFLDLITSQAVAFHLFYIQAIAFA